MQLTKGTAFVPSITVHGEKIGTAPDADLWYGGWLYSNAVQRWTFGFSHSSCFVRTADGVVLSSIETVSAPSADLEAKVADLTADLTAAESDRDAARAAAKAAADQATALSHALTDLKAKVASLFSLFDGLRSLTK